MRSRGEQETKKRTGEIVGSYCHHKPLTAELTTNACEDPFEIQEDRGTGGGVRGGKAWTTTGTRHLVLPNHLPTSGLSCERH
ncbi:hypothetical protein KSD_73100 [Ktedonobacter sp. SOSP1-85]|nr:hypothetical protein KSD_73100 [Ktedonobacter sp. SOSP1-85]